MNPVAQDMQNSLQSPSGQADLELALSIAKNGDMIAGTVVQGDWSAESQGYDDFVLKFKGQEVAQGHLGGNEIRVDCHYPEVSELLCNEIHLDTNMPVVDNVQNTLHSYAAELSHQTENNPVVLFTDKKGLVTYADASQMPAPPAPAAFGSGVSHQGRPDVKFEIARCYLKQDGTVNHKANTKYTDYIPMIDKAVEELPLTLQRPTHEKAPANPRVFTEGATIDTFTVNTANGGTRKAPEFVITPEKAQELVKFDCHGNGHRMRLVPDPTSGKGCKLFDFDLNTHQHTEQNFPTLKDGLEYMMQNAIILETSLDDIAVPVIHASSRDGAYINLAEAYRSQFVTDKQIPRGQSAPIKDYKGNVIQEYGSGLMDGTRYRVTEDGKGGQRMAQPGEDSAMSVPDKQTAAEAIGKTLKVDVMKHYEPDR